MVFPNKLVGKKLEKFLYSTRGSYPLMASPCFSRSNKKISFRNWTQHVSPPIRRKERKGKISHAVLGPWEEGERREYSWISPPPSKSPSPPPFSLEVRRYGIPPFLKKRSCPKLPKTMSSTNTFPDIQQKNEILIFFICSKCQTDVWSRISVTLCPFLPHFSSLSKEEEVGEAYFESSSRGQNNFWTVSGNSIRHKEIQEIEEKTDSSPFFQPFLINSAGEKRVKLFKQKKSNLFPYPAAWSKDRKKEEKKSRVSLFFVKR